MNVNIFILAYAVGVTSRETLKRTLEHIGYSSQVVDCLMRKADKRKAQIDKDMEHRDVVLCDGGMEGEEHARTV